ncbi:unnamed protein product [Caenorhabditis brenneri]
MWEKRIERVVQVHRRYYADTRFVHFKIIGVEDGKAGSVYVELSTAATISYKSYGVGTLVKVEGVWTEPIVATIVKLVPEDGGLKRMFIFCAPLCGIDQNTEEESLEDDMVLLDRYWPTIKSRLQEINSDICIRGFQPMNCYDPLMSPQHRFMTTEIGTAMTTGLYEASKLLNQPRLRRTPAPLLNVYALDDKSAGSVLSNTDILEFKKALGVETPTEEQYKFFERVLDPKLLLHLCEACFGSGKTATAVASSIAKVRLDSSAKVALVSQTNNATAASLHCARLPKIFDPKLRHTKARPLVIQSRNWRESKGMKRHPFDWQDVIISVFLDELKSANPRLAFGKRVDELYTMYKVVNNSETVDIKEELDKEKISDLRSLNGQEYGKRDMLQLFFKLYRPNLYFSTMSMLVTFLEDLPVDSYPTMVLIDESSMVQPSDVALFASRLQFDTDKKIQYVLVGDHRQLHPFNTIANLIPLTISPNQLLLQQDKYVTSKLTTVFRLHPDGTRLISSIFYDNALRPGRPSTRNFIQARLPHDIFPHGARKAFHFKPNIHSSITVCSSRSNNGEAHEIAAYARTLIFDHQVAPQQIVALTPYSAQSELLQKVMPHNTTTTTTRKFQGQETSIVLFSACNHGTAYGEPSNGVTPDGRMVIGNDGKTVELKLINDPAIVLVSLTRARHFTVVFGNEKFLRSIPVWDKVITAIRR